MATVGTEAVWSQLSARLRAFIRSRVDDEQTADDLLQDTFVRIHQRIGTLSDEQRLEAWVFQIARNLVADHYRGRKPRAALPAEIAQEAPLGDAPDPNEEVASWLPAMIEELPPTYREAVKLVELEGVPQAEIARRLGISVSGAKSRVQRGREQLKQVLDRCCRIDLDRRGNVLGYQPRRQDSCEACE
jgi:RNA polymerase sigma-70 factor (ECF subfamily)